MSKRKIIYNNRLKKLARDLRKNMTPAEIKLWYGFLSSCEYRFLRQKPILEYIVDFYCPACKLIIEIDGESHFTEEGKEKDVKRTRKLLNLGIKEIRFNNHEVFNHFESVCESIDTILTESE